MNEIRIERHELFQILVAPMTPHLTISMMIMNSAPKQPIRCTQLSCSTVAAMPDWFVGVIGIQHRSRIAFSTFICIHQYFRFSEHSTKVYRRPRQFNHSFGTNQWIVLQCWESSWFPIVAARSERILHPAACSPCCYKQRLLLVHVCTMSCTGKINPESYRMQL